MNWSCFGDINQRSYGTKKIIIPLEGHLEVSDSIFEFVFSVQRLVVRLGLFKIVLQKLWLGEARRDVSVVSGRSTKGSVL